MQNILVLFIILLGLYLFTPQIENMSTSPATLIQLSASSGYYPFWQYGYGYRYPYYRYIMPYYPYDGYYSTQRFPRPYGYYNTL